MNSIPFKETQRLNQVWVWLILGLVNLVLIWMLITQLVLGQPVGDNPAPDGFLAFVVVVGLFMSALVISMRLETEIDEQGIHYRFTPFIPSFKTVCYDELQEATVRKYRPIIEYGGWGFRLGVMGKGKALNMRGNQGLQLVFKDGRRLLIGTQEPEALRQALTSFSTVSSSHQL